MAQDADSPNTHRRAHVFLTGRVQGVGMRFTVARMAPRHGATGWVRNLPDGRVEIVAEGAPPDLERFFEDLKENMEGYIRFLKLVWQPATGEFSGFDIAY